MERAVRLDGERLMTLLEATVQNLELLATLPEKAPANIDAVFQPAVRDALRHQVNYAAPFDPRRKLVGLSLPQFVVEPALLHFIAQQHLDDDERPETEEDRDEDELQEHTQVQSLLSGPVASRLFPKSLHQVLQQLKGDRTARDALRKLSATSVSPAMSRLTHAWMQLVINTDASLSTSFEQDERFAQSLRDSTLRLREIEDDRDQVAFELAQAREGRVAMSDQFTAQRARLEAQLRDTKRAADDILGPTAREREDFLQAAMSNFETQNSNAHEQLEAMQRTTARVTQTSQQAETDERKHTQHDATELREIIERYDDDMSTLDTEIEAERAELARLDAASAKFEMYFARIDKDRRNQVEEQRVMDLAERLRRNRDANLFQFILKIQALVRGFLARRRLRLDALRKKRRSRRKGRKGKKRTSKSPRRKTAVKKPSVKVRAKKA